MPHCPESRVRKRDWSAAGRALSTVSYPIRPGSNELRGSDELGPRGDSRNAWALRRGNVSMSRKLAAPKASGVIFITDPRLRRDRSEERAAACSGSAPAAAKRFRALLGATGAGTAGRGAALPLWFLASQHRLLADWPTGGQAEQPRHEPGRAPDLRDRSHRGRDSRDADRGDGPSAWRRIVPLRDGSLPGWSRACRPGRHGSEILALRMDW
jgi:hypothetical protein